MVDLYSSTSFECSKLITTRYSTSFTLGIKALATKFHKPIYGVYAFVRLADEIVDTFGRPDTARLLKQFKDETYQAIDDKISLNPVLNSFQEVVNEYHIEKELIEAFFRSMEMDLDKNSYEQDKYEDYIYGSAEVVGLMCLRIFCEGDDAQYQELKEPARRLGSAFQKVNFLRDMKSDYEERGRVYFPGIAFNTFDQECKELIEADIEADFEAALEGIRGLPAGARFGVYLAYIYYRKLLYKIRTCSVNTVLTERIRIPDNIKYLLLIKSALRYRLNII